MNFSGEELRNFWLRQRIAVREGATEKQIEQFEQKYQVHLPGDLRSYFATVNGMQEGETDEDLISFWPLEDLTLISNSDGENEQTTGRYFAFADWSINAHEYAIQLSSNPAVNCPVVVVYEPLIEVAESFSKFIAAYCETDYAVLFPPSPRSERQYSFFRNTVSSWWRKLLRK